MRTTEREKKPTPQKRVLMPNSFKTFNQVLKKIPEVKAMFTVSDTLTIVINYTGTSNVFICESDTNAEACYARVVEKLRIAFAITPSQRTTAILQHVQKQL